MNTLTPGNESFVETNLTGIDLLNRPTLNKGTAFTEDERDLFHLHGLLPPHIGTLEEQNGAAVENPARF